MLIDLQLRAVKQASPASGRPSKKRRHTDAGSAHFSPEYMAVVVAEVQQALRNANMDEAAQQARAVLAGTTSAWQSPSAEPAAAAASMLPGVKAELHTPACTGCLCQLVVLISNMVQGLFVLKHLVFFMKCTNLSNQCFILLKNDYPLHAC